MVTGGGGSGRLVTPACRQTCAMCALPNVMSMSTRTSAGTVALLRICIVVLLFFSAAASSAPPPPGASAVDCFNISGAKNSSPYLPNGTDLNGQYTKTAHTCTSKEVFQKGGSGGPVIYRDGDLYWAVGPSGHATDCEGPGRFSHVYLIPKASMSKPPCPSSPDGAGCAGKWLERDSTGYQPNPVLRIVAQTKTQTQTDVRPAPPSPGMFVHYQGAIDGPNCCTQLPAAWRNRTNYKTPRVAFETGDCFSSCDQNPDCPAASEQWSPGSCKDAVSQSGGSHPHTNFTVEHGSCTNEPDSECCTNWCTF